MNSEERPTLMEHNLYKPFVYLIDLGGCRHGYLFLKQKLYVLGCYSMGHTQLCSISLVRLYQSGDQEISSKFLSRSYDLPSHAF